MSPTGIRVRKQFSRLIHQCNAATALPHNRSGVYGKTLINPDLTDFAPRIGFAYAPLSKWTIRGGFGTGYVHYTRAGSGDIAAINAPQAQFASVTQIAPNTSNHCSTPLPAQIIATGTTTPSCYATAAQGFPTGLVTSFNSATDNITWVPKNTRDSYVENYYLAVQRQLGKNSLVDIAYVGNHGLKLQHFLNGNQRNINVDTPDHNHATPPLRQLAFGYYRGAQRVLFQLQRIAGPV